MPTLITVLLPTLFSRAITHPVDPPGSQIFPCTATFEVPPRPCATEQSYVYAATETLFSEVDCAGCLNATIHTTSNQRCPTKTGPGPLETIDGTTTEWEAICSPTPTLPLIHPYNGPHRRQEPPIGRPVCPTTLVIPVEGIGATETVYERYVTVTSHVPCGSCDLVTSTMVGGLGAIRSPGITATEPVGTSTVYACQG